MTVDLDTRWGQDYAPRGGVLPDAGSAIEGACGGAAGRDERDAFACSRERFEAVAGWLSGAEAGALAHAELEARLEVEARELLRLLLQDHLDLRAVREERVADVVGCEGVRRGSVGPVASGR